MKIFQSLNNWKTINWIIMDVIDLVQIKNDRKNKWVLFKKNLAALFIYLFFFYKSKFRQELLVQILMPLYYPDIMFILLS